MLHLKTCSSTKKLRKESQWEILPWPPLALNWHAPKNKGIWDIYLYSILRHIAFVPSAGLNTINWQNSYSGWYTTWMPWTNVTVPGGQRKLAKTRLKDHAPAFTLANTIFSALSCNTLSITSSMPEGMCAELVSAARTWPHLARIEFPLWVVGSNTFARLHEEPGHHMSWWSWSSDLGWLSLRKTESFLAQTVFFFWKIKLQWNDDQHLIANLSIPATMLGSKVGTVRFVWHTSSRHPQHWVENHTLRSTRKASRLSQLCSCKQLQKRRPMQNPR